MKTKKINKKRLELKKVTISHLNSNQLNGAKGGLSVTCGTHLCETYEVSCECTLITECATCPETDCDCQTNTCITCPTVRTCPTCTTC